MGNIPIHLRAQQAKGKSYGRQAVWEAIRRLREYSTKELRLAVPHVSGTSVDDYNTCLVKAGIVTKKVLGRSGGREIARYTLAQDSGNTAPRVDKAGNLLPETGTQRLWRTMKMLKEFNALELATHASLPGQEVEESTASQYARHLATAGYLAVAVPGKPGQLARYRLVRNTGAHAPQIQRTKAVFDPNTGQAFALETLGE